MSDNKQTKRIRLVMVAAAASIGMGPMVVATAVILFFSAATESADAAVAHGCKTEAAAAGWNEATTAGWTPQRIANATTIVGVAVDRGLGRRGAVIGVMTAMTESTLDNVDHGDNLGPDSTGLFQQRDPWGPRSVRNDPAGAAGLFFDALIQVDNWATEEMANVAQAVQRSQFSDGSNYRFYAPEAEALVTDILNANPRYRDLADAQTVVETPVVEVCGDKPTGTTAGPAPGGTIDPGGTPEHPHGVVTVAGRPDITTVLQTAMDQIGRPYCWGGGNSNGPTKGIPTTTGKGQAPEWLSPGCSSATPGFDCSGLALYAYAQIGKTLTHQTKFMYGEGTKIPLADRQPGDLAFRSRNGAVSGIHHVVIISVNDQIIEASQDGVPVRTKAFNPTDSELMPYVIRIA